MPRTNIPVLTIKGDQASGVDLTAGGVAASAANDHKLFNPAGRTLLMVFTSSIGAGDLTFVSVADPYGRVEDLGPTTVGASKSFAFGPFANLLFSQQSGADRDYVYVDLANVTAVCTLTGLNI